MEELSFNLVFNGSWQSLPTISLLNPSFINTHTYLDPEKIKTLTTNFFVYGRPINYYKYFYDKWKKNLNKSDQIDLNNRPKAQTKIKYWPSQKYNLYLRSNLIIFFIIYIINREIGRIGLWLKKYYPKVYFYLLKIKNKK